MTEAAPKKKHQPHSHEYWLGLVRANIARLDLLDAESIARMLVNYDKRGTPISVWHASSLFHGHVCNCQPCAKLNLTRVPVPPGLPPTPPVPPPEVRRGKYEQRVEDQARAMREEEKS